MDQEKWNNGVAPVQGQKLRNDNDLENNVLHIKTTNLEECKIENFWKLDLL